MFVVDTRGLCSGSARSVMWAHVSLWVGGKSHVAHGVDYSFMYNSLLFVFFCHFSQKGIVFVWGFRYLFLGSPWKQHVAKTKLPKASCQKQIAKSKLPKASYQKQVAIHKLPKASCHKQVSTMVGGVVGDTVGVPSI